MELSSYKKGRNHNLYVHMFIHMFKYRSLYHLSKKKVAFLSHCHCIPYVVSNCLKSRIKD